MNFRLASCLFALALACWGWGEVRYTLEPDPVALNVAVSIEFEAPRADPVVRIPAWCPGFYFLLDYPSKLFDLAAKGGVERVDETGWQLDADKGQTVRLNYRVQGDDPGLGFFGVSVLSHTAFVNGPAAFMYVEGMKSEPAALTIRAPQGWDVATSMAREGEGWVASDYDELIDHPIQLGQFVRRTWESDGQPFEAVFVTRGEPVRANLDRVVNELKRVSEAGMAIFGPLPLGRYTYLVHLAVGSFGGGLEHRAGTVLATPNAADVDLAHLAAHEFVHTWNVKQIRPVELGPFDYTGKVRSRHLWFSEGVTDYYAHRVMRLAGLDSADEMLRRLAGQIAEVERSQVRQTTTLEQVCLGAWESGGFGRGDLSFYSMGAVVGLLLDAAIRAETGGAKSLDDAMRLMFERYRLPKPGFGPTGIEDAVSEVAGKDLRPMLRSMVASTDGLPYRELRRIGLRLRFGLIVTLDALPEATAEQRRLREEFLNPKMDKSE